MKKLISILLVVLFISCISVTAQAKNNTSASNTSSSTTSTSSKSTSKTVKNVTVTTPKSFSVSENYNSVILSWKRNKNANGYIISRSTDNETWKKIKKIKNNKTTSFIDTKAEENTLYYYSVKAYKIVDNKTYCSVPTSVVPIFFGVNFSITSLDDSVALSWSKIEEANGYELYYSTDSVNFTRIKSIKNNSRVAFTKNKLENPYTTNHYFYIKAYNIVDNKRNYFYISDVLNSTSLEAVINGSVGKPKTNFKTYNVQGKKACLAYKTNITKADKQIFNNFNKEHFTADMSAYYRIYYTFMFIHKKVTYATGGLWSKIGNSTYADAIFNKRLGQCAQYNGAMVEYLANLGFNAKVIMGYRGRSNSDKWQHFWGQVKLKNGITYVVETGNYGNDGDWNYFFKQYKNTKKYLKCGKYVSGIKA